jgi:hypothetical protein
MTGDILPIQLRFRIQLQFSVDRSPSEPEEALMRNLIRALIAALSLVALPVVSHAGLFVGVSVNVAPPVLPVYVQPPCPAPGYIWMPGYWAWDDGYYWVPGTWVLAPAVGLLWTPGYWGWADGVYVWNAGYWGPHVGFYGGINYGFGYTGVGYQGGYWEGSRFYYNRAVTNINTTNITNVYNRTVVNNVNVTRVSFNGGAGGVAARPTAAELSAQHERHLGLTPVQRQHEQSARGNSSLRAAVNGGHPAVAATSRAGVFSGHGVVAARGAEHAGGGPGAAGAPHAGAQRSERLPTAQHSPTREGAPAHAPQPQHYANVQSNSRGSPFEHEPRAETARPSSQYSARSAPVHGTEARTPYQGRPTPQYQPPPAHQARPEVRYQPPAPHYQPAPASQGAGRAAHESQRPEHGGSADRGAERNGHG